MSHEIRTPLNGVLALTELVLDGELTDEQRSYLDKVYSSARSLLSIIDDVLDLSKIEAKKLSLNHHPLDLDDLLASVHDVFTQIAENKGIELTVHRHQSLPQRITGDVDRIRQILVNLVSNAVKFTEEGRVTLTARPEDGNRRVLFEVDDTGVGIDKADQERIFESFTQANGGFSRRYGGAGLGLSISRQLALRMGGTLTFESDVGRGSRFRLELPLQEASEAEESSEPPRRPSPHNADGGGRILVAEDNAINSLVLTKILEKAGFSVAKAGSGTEVLRHLASERFDAVLMDISMPGMDGITAARRIRAGEASEVNTDVPIVAITAHAMKGDRERFFEAGMDGYVAKPFTQDTVLESVHAALAAGEERA
jgi:CheY-like chemotaxis protein